MYLPTRAISRTGLGALIRSTRARHESRSGATSGSPRPSSRTTSLPRPGLEHQRDLVDRVGGLGRDDRLGRDVREQRDLLADLVGDRVVGAQDDDVGLDADAAQLLDRVLGRLRLELARGGQRGEQRDVDVQHVRAADVLAHLADGLEERQRFDVADGPADLDDDDVRVAVARDAPDPLLDLVGDVRDDLDRAAEVVAAPLLGDDRLVDAAGRDVAELAQVLVDEPLVVTEVEVGLGAVIGDEDLAVLVRAHRARIHVDVRIELQDGDAQAACLEDAADAGGGDALAQRGGHASGHKDILRHGSGSSGGFSNATGRALPRRIGRAAAQCGADQMKGPPPLRELPPAR